MRIGGDFEIDVSMLSQEPVYGLPVMPSLHDLWMDTGRSALLVALRDIIKRGGARKALLPAYICPSVVAPFLKLGFKLRFYSADMMADSLQIEEYETILLAHYLGKRNLPVVDWVRNRQAILGFFVIEDCVQASLSTNVGDIGDYVITSFRKFLPQPDGAMLGSRTEIFDADLGEPDEAFISAKLAGKFLRNSNCDGGIFLKLFGDAEARLDILSPRRLSWLSTYMMERTDIQLISSIRRTNWLTLYSCLDKNGLFKYLKPVFETLADGEVPLGFPVRVVDGQRDELRRFLASKEIYCPVHWDLDHLVGFKDMFLDEIELSKSILTFPIDQRMRLSNVEFLVETAADFYRAKE